MPAVAISAVNTGTDTLTAVAHGLLTGDRCRVRNVGGALPTGLTGATDVFAIRTDADNFKLATSNANALAGTPVIDITGAGSGTNTVEYGLPYAIPNVIAAAGVQVKSADLNGTWNSLVALYDLLTGQAQAIWNTVTIALGLVVGGALRVGGELLAFADFSFTADSTTDLVTKTAHGLETGDGPVRVSNSGGGLPGGLSAGTDYWAIRVDANNIFLATARANALALVPINLTTNGTGTQTLLHQTGTTRVSDAEVTRHLTVDGNLAVGGTLTLVDTEIYSMAFAQGAAGTTPANGGGVANAPPTIALGTVTNGAVNCPLRLRVGTTLTAWQVRLIKATSGAATVTAKLWKSTTGAAVSQIGGSVANSANAPGLISLGQAGGVEVVAVNSQYFIEVIGSGTNGDTAVDYQNTTA